MIGASDAIYPRTLDLSKFVGLIEENGITTDIISDILGEASIRRQWMSDIYDWYVGDGDPILQRKYLIEGVEQTDKINNKITTDYFGRIVNTKVGYLFGEDPAVSLDKARYGRTGFSRVLGDYNAKAYETDRAQIADYRSSEYISDQDVEIGKYASICGYGGRLLWYDGKNGVHSLVVKPWDCLFLSSGEVYNAEYAIRIYDVWNLNGSITTKLDFYDDLTVTRFESKNGTQTGISKIGYSQVGEPEAHGFDGCPLIGYANNRELQGEAEKVLCKILEYARGVSDMSSEFEQLRLAYMVFENIDIDADTLKQMRQTGAIRLRSSGAAPAKAYFLTKNIDAGAHNEHLNRIHKDILSDSGTVDLSDPSFYTSLSAVAIKMRTMSLENRSKTTESKFRAANRNMWKLICNFWQRTNQGTIDYLAITETWKRNLPYNKLEEAKILATIRGQVSDETAWGQSTLVDDPEKEKLRVEMEGGRNPFGDADIVDAKAER